MSFPFEQRLRGHLKAGVGALRDRRRQLQRVDTPTSVGVYAGFSPAGTPGHFSPGNATVGQRGTIPGADWFEGVQEELISILDAAGITPVKGALSQVWQAILACRQMTDIGSAANTCIANPAVPVTALVNGMEVNLLVANTNTGASTFNLSSLGGIMVVRPDGSPVQPGDLTQGQAVPLVYLSATPQWRLKYFPARIRLTSNLSLYVNSASGSDSNNGLSAGFPFATMNKAYNWLQQSVDIGGNVVTINCLGTTLAPLAATGPCLGAAGAASIVFLGNTGSPSAVQVNASNANAFSATADALFTVKGFQLSATGSSPNGFGLSAGVGSQIVFNNLIFSSCAAGHLWAADSAQIFGTGTTYTISGNAPSHALASQLGLINLQGATVTLSGTPAFSTAFVQAYDLGHLFAPSFSIAGGSATGTRYSATLNGVIDTNGGGASYFPGNAGGSTPTGGQYN